MGIFKKRTAPLQVEGCLSHIAFIMDGNGRWARRRGLARSLGHAAGAEACRRVFRRCRELGIHTVTVYAFSTENWSRPQEEVDALMKLFDRYLDDINARFDEYDARFVFIGDKAALPASLREKMLDIEARSLARGSEYTLNLAINYGGRDEIAAAVNSLIAKGATSVTPADISAHLYTSASPDPDLIVRTAGEQRLSNFLLWQASYAELYFTDTLWPDMKNDDVDAAVRAFLTRTRRFGGVK